MKKYFNSNETLEMCDVKVAEDGRIEIQTKPYHAPELARLGKPEKTIRGRVVMEEGHFVFAPYAEASRKPTYSRQVVVGSTTLGVTEDKVKISFMVPRHLAKPLMLMYIQSEIDEVKRRLETDVYDTLVSGQQTADPLSPADSSPSRGRTQSPMKIEGPSQPPPRGGDRVQ